MKFLSRRSKSSVGLDIGSSSVKIVEVDHGKDGPVLKSYGIVKLPPEAIVEGEIMDRSLVIEGIQECMAKANVDKQDVVTAVSGRAVIVKKIIMDKMNPDDAKEAVFWEAEQHVPFDIDDVCLSFEILKEDVGANQMEVLLVAAKKEMVDTHANLIRDAGYNPVIIDVDSFAVQNAYEVNHDLDANKVVALVNMGAGVTNINILSHGSTVFWRDISFGGNQFTEALQREYNLSFDQAERVKRGQQVEECSAAEARAVLDSVSAEMASEIQKTFDFFAATAAEDSVDELVLSGGCAQTPNLQSVLQERFGVRTELMNPLRRIHYRESDFDSQWLQSIAPMLTVAVGLAVRKVGE